MCGSTGVKLSQGKICFLWQLMWARVVGEGVGRTWEGAPVSFAASSWAESWGQLSLSHRSRGHLFLQKQDCTEDRPLPHSAADFHAYT